MYLLEKVEFGDVLHGAILSAEYLKFILSVPFTCRSRATFTLRSEPFAENVSLSDSILPLLMLGKCIVE